MILPPLSIEIYTKKKNAFSLKSKFFLYRVDTNKICPPLKNGREYSNRINSPQHIGLDKIIFKNYDGNLYSGKQADFKHQNTKEVFVNNPPVQISKACLEWYLYLINCND